MFTMVFPAALITVTSILVFCLPAASGEKVSLGVTALLTLTVFLLSVADAMPPQSNNIPLLGIHCWFCCLLKTLPNLKLRKRLPDWEINSPIYSFCIYLCTLHFRHLSL